MHHRVWIITIVLALTLMSGTAFARLKTTFDYFVLINLQSNTAFEGAGPWLLKEVVDAGAVVLKVDKNEQGQIEGFTEVPL